MDSLPKNLYALKLAKKALKFMLEEAENQILHDIDTP
jgi:hypothetical protein